MLAAHLLLGSCGSSSTGEPTLGGTPLPQPPVSPGAGGVSATVTAVALTPQTVTLTAGETTALTATLSTTGAVPAGGWTTTWQSSDAAIVGVSSAGELTAVAAGTATITATAGGISASAAVTVVPQPAVTAIALSPAALALAVGAEGTIVPSLSTVGALPAGGWPVSWQSSAPAVAKVGGAGIVTAVAAGSATISATAGGKSATVVVTVEAGVAPPQSGVTAIELWPPAKMPIAVGLKRSFTAKVTATAPEPATGWSIAWTTSNAAVATVASTGQVTAIAPGLATISATLGGKSDSQPVEIVPQPGLLDLRILGSDFALQQGDRYTLTTSTFVIGITPPGGLVFTWSSSNPAVATVVTVDGEGDLTAVALGTATIKVSGHGKSDSIIVTVVPKIVVPQPPAGSVSAITLQPSPAVLSIAYPSFGVEPSVKASTPKPGQGWPLAWSIADPSVAVIDRSNSDIAMLKPLALGKTTLTATLADVTASVDVYVAELTTFALTPTTLSLPVGTQSTLALAMSTLGPLPPTGWPVYWTTTSPMVATVSPAGVVTALGVGRARITVAAGSKVQTSMVTVTGPMPTIALTGPDTVKGTVAQNSQGYELDCRIPTQATMSGPGLVQWTKVYESFGGALPYQQSSFLAFSARTMVAGQTVSESGRMYRVIYATASQISAFTMALRFHYTLNAERGDPVATDYYLQRNVVCAP